MATNSSQVSRIVSNFMTQRLKSKGYDLTTSDHHRSSPSSSSSSPSSSSSCGVSHSLLSQTLLHQADEMMADYGDAIRDMVDRAVSHRSHNLVIDSACSTTAAAAADPPLDNYNSFKLMADSMISDGIQWSHILTLLVFVTELAYEQGVRQSNGATFIASCSDWLVRYFSSDAIRQFLESNGGWEGMIAWAEEKSAGNSPPSAGNNSSPSLTNGLLLGIGSAVTAAIAFLSLR